MLRKKKLYFWRLAFIFAAFVVITLVLLWSQPQAVNSAMMNESMGDTMKSMHASNITIYNLFARAEIQDKMQEMHSHHQNQATLVYKLHFLTTSTVFLLLPLIIGGSIILAIVWI